jgi:hypothetical protein
MRFFVILCAATFSLAAAVKVEKIAYKGWPDCYRVTNGEIELVVTASVGPRVMRYGYLGGQNVFKEFSEQLGKSGEKEFQLRGGHRVWKAPEDAVATWAPDNVPVQVTPTTNGLIALEPVEPLTGLQKEIAVEMADTGSHVRVSHRIHNRTLFPLEFAPWALTMMAPGGMAITGFPPRGKHPQVLAATNPLVMWAYTDLSDSRWRFTKKYMTLTQDPKASEPQKLGHFNPKTWAAYLLNGDLFVKQSVADPAKAYPDFGCSFETFTNADFLEMETIGPMTKVQPGGSVEHTEQWSLHRGVKINSITDAELDRAIAPLLNYLIISFTNSP